MIDKLWAQAVDFHGHACPGLAIGVRACEIVKKHPDLGTIEYGRLKCVTENDACGVDAIQCLLGCSIGKGNLVYKKIGKMAYSFFDAESGTSLRICFKNTTKHEKSSREQLMNIILSLPLGELFSCSTPPMPAPEPARIFSSIVCESCGEGTAEPAIRLDNGKKVCLECCNLYTRGWG